MRLQNAATDIDRLLPGSLLLCICSGRWEDASPAAQCLVQQAAQTTEVVVWESPTAGGAAAVRQRQILPRLTVLTPALPMSRAADRSTETALLQKALAAMALRHLVVWLTDPRGSFLATELGADVIVYEPGTEPDDALLEQAALVVTTSPLQFQALRSRHEQVLLLPVLGATESFAAVRRFAVAAQPASRIRRPRLGYFGPIDGRIDLELVGAMAQRRPEWQFVLGGRVASGVQLPMRENVSVEEITARDLPAQVARCDVALFPFARHAALPLHRGVQIAELLAAGVPVIATPVPEIVAGFGDGGLVELAGDALAAIHAAEMLMARDPADWLAKADRYLSRHSVARSWARLAGLIRQSQATTRTLPGLSLPPALAALPA